MPYAFPRQPVPRVLTPETISLPMRVLVAHRDRRSKLASFIARRMLSQWRLWFALSELAPRLTRQRSAIRFTLGRIDRSFTFDARYAVFRPFYLGPVYEPELFLLFQQLAPLIEVFLDVGASVGMHSHCLAASAAFDGRIHCFEPEPQTRSLLAGIAQELGTDGRIDIHGFGLSDRSRAAFFASPAATNDTSVVHVAETAEGNGFSAEVRRLDDLDLGLQSAMKIDVEGHELQVIEGGLATIARARPFIVFEAIYESPGTEAIVARLNAMEYRIFFLEFAAADGRESVLDLPRDATSATLELHPYAPEIRAARRRTLNLFACPRERIADLESRCGLEAIAKVE